MILKTFKFNTRHKKLLADTVTPVSIYLKIRDKYLNAIMLESSDYHGHDNSFSYICCDPVASFQLDRDNLRIDYPDQSYRNVKINNRLEAVRQLEEFARVFQVEPDEFNFINNGLFGYMSYDAVTYFEDLNVNDDKPDYGTIPQIIYRAYRYVIAIDHFKNELHLFEHNYVEETPKENGLEQLTALVNNKNFPAYHFDSDKEEKTNYSDNEFLEIISKGVDHCHRGDVFQVVLSRKYQTKFNGDEFNVYRALRSINPSPYLFYFDYGDFKIFGSSPEAQLVIKDRKAAIYPIAGTFKRTGNDLKDAALAEKLSCDPKENSEHVMLVDLARNDLSRTCDDVIVETFREIQYYSHVIHLVSKVTGKLKENISPIEIVTSTFPAGTLSGAPKHMAMQLIDRYEKNARGYYGGAIGFLGFNGDFNHTIMIRSMMSKDNRLHYQAGAGIVAKSNIEDELQEVENKLEALRKAIRMACEIDKTPVRKAINKENYATFSIG